MIFIGIFCILSIRLNEILSFIKKTENVSNNKIIITYDLTFSLMEFQLLNNAIGVIIVVNITKYIDNPSKPK